MFQSSTEFVGGIGGFEGQVGLLACRPQWLGWGNGAPYLTRHLFLPRCFALLSTSYRSHHVCSRTNLYIINIPNLRTVHLIMSFIPGLLITPDNTLALPTYIRKLTHYLGNTPSTWLLFKKSFTQ